MQFWFLCWVGGWDLCLGLAQRAGLQAGPGAQAGARGQGPGLGVRASRVRIPQRTGESSRAGDPRRGSRRRLGSSRRLACHQTSSLTPIFNIPTAGLRPLRLLVWPQGLQMPSSLRYRTRHLGLGHPLGSRGGADAGLGLRARAPTAVILQGGDPQALLLSWSPGTLSGTEGASPRGPPGPLCFWLSWFPQQVQGRTEPYSGLGSARTSATRCAGLTFLCSASRPPTAGIAWTPSVPSSESLSTSAPIGWLS